MLALLARERREDQFDLLARQLLGDGDEDVRRTEVAVVLRDLVLEDQVVAERVPRELADEAVILVEVMPRVREDQIGIDSAFISSNTSFTSVADVREVPVAKPVHDDFRPCCGA